MHHKLLVYVLSILLTLSSLQADEPILTKQLKFTKTIVSKGVVGRLKGYSKKNYEVKASTNQLLEVDLISGNVYFNIYAPDTKNKNTAMFMSKGEGNHFSKVLVKEGIYVISVFLKEKEVKANKSFIFHMNVKLD